MSAAPHHPPEGATQFNEPANVTLNASQRGTVTFSGQSAGVEHVLPVLAISKHADTTYEVKAEGSTVFGPAPVPPTDIDDIAVTFLPPITFVEDLEVIIDNTGASQRTYTAQPIGWEVPQ